MDPTRTFECYICDKKFANFHLIKNHIRYSHNPPSIEPNHVCEICSALVRPRHLRVHMETHEANREKFQCEICNRWLLVKSRTAHMKNHMDPGVNCKICGKFLKSSYSLSTHMKVKHVENRRYKCEFCEKSFYRKLKLVEHVAVRHTREILFTCRVEGCGREFRAEGKKILKFILTIFNF